MAEILVALLGGLGLVLTTIVGVWLTMRQQGTRTRQVSDLHADQANRIERKLEILRTELEAHVRWEQDPDPAQGKYAEIETLLLELTQAMKRRD